MTTYFCYDYADRLIGGSNTLYNGGDYDTHGTMTSLGTGTTPLRLCFDSSDRNTCMTQRDSSGTGIAMYYTRDVQGRIVARYKNTLTNWTAAAAGDYYYGFTGAGDTPDYVRDENWDIIEKTLQLPGGVNLTIKPQQSGNNQKQYSLPNIHGDTLLTTNAAGTNTSNGNGPLSTFTYDPFGTVLNGSVLPANTASGSASYGYVGQHEKLTEREFTVTPIQMGARVYIPGIGRFLQVDPVEGGTENNYVYPVDPVNEFDLTGQFSLRNVFKKTTKVVAKNRSKILASAAFGACVVASAGACLGVGVAAAAVNAGFTYAQNRGNGWRKAGAKTAISFGADIAFTVVTSKVKMVREAGKIVLGGRSVALSWQGARRALSTVPGRTRFVNNVSVGLGNYYGGKGVDWINGRW